MQIPITQKTTPLQLCRTHPSTLLQNQVFEPIINQRTIPLNKDFKITAEKMIVIIRHYSNPQQLSLNVLFNSHTTFLDVIIGG